MRVVIALLALALSTPVWAQDDDRSLFEILRENGLSNANGLQNASEFKDVVAETFDNPETQSVLLNRYFQSKPSWLFLKDINFEFKVFDVAGDKDGALGFTYDYDRSVADMPLSCAHKSCVRGLDFSISANGNVALDSDTNPNDFLKTEVSFGFFQSRGGSPNYRDDAHSDEVFDKLLEFELEFVEAETDEQEEQAIQEVIGLVRPLISNQFYFEISGDGSLESNQDFTMKQYTYGIHGVLEVKSWQMESGLSKLNFFDYPFAVIRTLSGYEDCGACFRPRGTSWPTLLLGIDRVSPDDDDPRAMVGDSSDYDRFRAELSFKTPIAQINENSIYLGMNYRYYKELDAMSAIEAADLDSYDYFTLSIGGSDGVYVSYSSGRLPLDAVDDKVYELGFQFQLGK